MTRTLVLTATHLVALALGFALGVYVLPIWTAPEGPDATALRAAAGRALYTGQFRRDLPGSDILHWGEGTVSVARDVISHEGRLSPGPDYKLYLARRYVDTRDAFLAIKDDAVRVGDIKTFNGFMLTVPPGVSVSDYAAVVVWCEAFRQFISAAKYK